MHSFKDADGREWSVVVRHGTLKKMRETMSLDIFNDVENVCNKLASDVFLLADVLFLVCEKQAIERKFSREEFYDLIFGDTIVDATSAFLGAVTDFFPSARRQILRKMLEKTRAIDAMVLQKIETQLDSLDVSTCIESFTNSPESVDSTPTE